MGRRTTLRSLGRTGPTSLSTWVTGVCVGMVTTAVATIFGFVLGGWLDQPDLAMVQLLGILIVAMRFPMGPALASVMISVLSFDYFFIPPRFEFAWTDAKSGITFAVMVITGAVVAHVNQKLRSEQRRALAREQTTAALYRLSSDLAAARTVKQATAIAARDLSDLFGANVFIAAAGATTLHVEDLEPADAAAAEQCWRKLAPVGRDAAGKNESSTWLPLVTAHRPIGVLGIPSWALAGDTEPATEESIERCAQVVGTALERIDLAEAARQAELRVEVEQLRNSLLSAVSHDIRTPLASIVTAGSVLAHPGGPPEEERFRIAHSIVEEADRLSRLTESLLELARLRTGHIALRRESIPVDELLEAGLHRLQSRLEKREVKIDLREDVPLVSVDRILIEQVIVNLLENSIRYAPTGPIELSAAHDGDSVILSVADRGPGLSPGEEERIFERFYRGTNAENVEGGLGLGLTIARTVVESHGGILRVENRQGGGVVARVRLPRAHELALEEPAPAPELQSPTESAVPDE